MIVFNFPLNPLQHLRAHAQVWVLVSIHELPGKLRIGPSSVLRGSQCPQPSRHRVRIGNVPSAVVPTERQSAAPTSAGVGAGVAAPHSRLADRLPIAELFLLVSTIPLWCYPCSFDC